MKEYSIIPQEKNNFCVCSVLQSIFNKYNISMSQKEISKNLTPSKKGFEIDDKKIRDFLNNKGFYYNAYWKNETPFNEPEIVLEEMIKYDGFIGIGNHVYLVNEFNDPEIIVTDPADVSKIEKDLYSVRREMEKANSGYFCLLKNNTSNF